MLQLANGLGTINDLREQKTMQCVHSLSIGSVAVTILVPFMFSLLLFALKFAITAVVLALFIFTFMNILTGFITMAAEKVKWIIFFMLGLFSGKSRCR